MGELELSTALEGTVVDAPACDARVAYCRCREPLGHYPETPHRCDPRCGGAWTGEEPDFDPVEFPRGFAVPGLRFDEEW